MRFDGIVSKWDDGRGFGFITPKQGGQQVFVHISAFPRNSERPQLGEHVTFEVETTPDKKKRALNVLLPQPQGRASTPDARTSRRSTDPDDRKSRGTSKPFAALAFLGLIAFGGYQFAFNRHEPIPATPDLSVAVPEQPSLPQRQPSVQFRCDGRTHCSQMTSCEEATFFLKNCPGTQMDGNNDGVPCEQQWCTSSF